jgi:hypothetical protein
MRREAWLGFAIWLILGVNVAYAADVPAPQSIVIVACKVIDMTGQPGRHGVDAAGNYNEEAAAKDWRDLELYINPRTQQYECKREQLDLVDGAIFGDNAPKDLLELTPDFADWGFCAHVGMMQAADYNREHPGWGVVAVGCPTRIISNETGATVGWQMPSCPTYLPGTQSRMRCDFTDSVI